MRSRRIVVGLAGLGALISAYLLWVHYSGQFALCVGFGGCEVVQASRFSAVGPVPVALIGFAGFTALLVVAVARLRSEAEGPFIALFALSLGATAFVAYLTWVELFVIGAVCLWCVSVAVCAIAVFALAMRDALQRYV